MIHRTQLWEPPWRPQRPARAAQEDTREVWRPQELIRRAGAPKANLQIGPWVRPMSTGYKLLLADLSSYHAVRDARDEGEALATHQAQAWLLQDLIRLNGVGDWVNRYMARRVHSRRAPVGELGRLVATERRLLARTYVALGSEPRTHVSMAELLTRVRNTPESADEPKERIARLMGERR